MRLLLDTHTFLWLDSTPEKLSEAALAACNDPNNALVLSVVSVWEIQIKTQINRLELNVPLQTMVEVHQADNGLQLLPVEFEHVYALQTLPMRHNDPFDRLLIAQASTEQLTLLSADEQFANYEVTLLW